jgi:hypothetical protein
VFTIKYNRTTNHIAGIAAKCTSKGNESGGVVADYAQNACGSITRSRLADGKTYSAIQEAYDAASKHTRRICKTCAKAALALIAEELEVAQAPVEDAEHQVGEEMYFIPSAKRTSPAYIPAGKVVVAKVVDHGQETQWAPRFSYVVYVKDLAAATQGTDASELFAPGSVPKDYRFWETYTTAVCGDCGESVAYANTKIVSEPIHRDGPVYAGMCTTREKRVCVSC